MAGAGSFILVVMLSTDEVVNKLIKLPLNVTENDLKVLSALLNATMVDLSIEEFTPGLMERVMRSAGDAASLVPVIVEFTTSTLRRQHDTNVAVAGHMRLLDQPEFRDVEKAQRMLTTLDEDPFSNLPAVMNSANGTQVLVGPENISNELKDTSVVMTKFDIGDGLQGMIGSLIFYTLGQNFCKLENIVSSKNEIHKTITCFNFLYNAWFLHHTTAKSNLHMWSFFL